MSNESYIAYWSGEEPTGPGKSPTLDMTPDYVDVVVLFYVVLAPDKDNTLDFKRLVLYNDQATIKGWMQDIRTRQQGQNKKTKFTLGLLGDSFPLKDPESFAQAVKAAYDDWGVDGITIDYEPPSDNANIVNVVQAIRAAIGDYAIMTAPIYTAWQDPSIAALLKPYAAYFNYIETMDYSPYSDRQGTIDAVNWYAQTIGTPEDPKYNKMVIGVSCMEPDNGDFTPLDDVVYFCGWQPPNGARKLGIMLYTLSYDVSSHGSGYPDGTFTKTIHENLP